MKRGYLTILVTSILVITSCDRSESNQSLQAINPFPEIQDSAVMIAPGNISGPNPEFATTWNPELNQLVFNRTSPDRSVIFLYTSSFDQGGWSKPISFPYSDSTTRDIDPFLFGDRLYFSRIPTGSASSEKDNYDIFFSDLINGQWTIPQKEGLGVNTENDEIFVTLSKNGNMYFSVFEFGTRNVAIYKKTAHSNSDPERLIFKNDTARLTNPAIAPDESFLITTSGNLVGYGSADLYISYPTLDGNWSNPQNLGPKVNSSYTEFAPGISADGMYLFFTSERPGMVPKDSTTGRPPGDLYIVRLQKILENIKE